MTPIPAGTTVFDPSTEEVEAVAHVLGTNIRSGLTAEEAQDRLERHGRNELRASVIRSAYYQTGIAESGV